MCCSLADVPKQSLFVQQLKMSGDSSHTWDVTPPSRARLVDQKVEEPISVLFQFSRGAQQLELRTKRVLSRAEDEQLTSVLNGTSQSLLLKHLYPVFQRLQVGVCVSCLPGAALIACSLQSDGSVLAYQDDWADCRLHLHTDPNNVGVEWWSIETESINGRQGLNSTRQLTLFVLLDVVLWEKLTSSVTSTTIMTLYLSFVLTIGRFLRSATPRCERIIYEDTPNVRSIKELVLDVFAARFDHDYELEEEL